MNRTLQPALTLYVIGLRGLGLLALFYHDFALDRQPVPPRARSHPPSYFPSQK